MSNLTITIRDRLDWLHEEELLEHNKVWLNNHGYEVMAAVIGDDMEDRSIVYGRRNDT